MAFGRSKTTPAAKSAHHIEVPSAAEVCEEFAAATAKAHELDAQSDALVNRIEETRESLEEIGRAGGRTREAAEELLRTGKIPEAGVMVDPALLQRLQRDKQVVDEARTLQKRVVDRARAGVAQKIGRKLRPAYLELAAAAAADLEAYGEKMAELMRVHTQLSDTGTLDASAIPNLANSWSILADPQSGIRRQIEALRTGIEN